VAGVGISINNFKQRISSGQPLLGAGVTAGTVVADVLLRCQVDWVFIDMETLPVTASEVSHMLDLSLKADVPAMVRLNDHNPAIIRQVLDAGASGVIAPMVSTAAQAKSIVQAAYYPPQGQRGLASAKRQGYGGGWDQTRLLTENASVSVVLMIETQEGLHNIDAIAAQPGVDALFVGTGDLSASLGVLGQAESKVFDEALVRVAEAAKRHSISLGGMVGNESNYARLRALGFTLLLAGLDLNWLQQAARQRLGDLKRWEPM
jgi:2-keto-3-deoxy-L-rhamnonate aldolase RhmA